MGREDDGRIPALLEGKSARQVNRIEGLHLGRHRVRGACEDSPIHGDPAQTHFDTSQLLMELGDVFIVVADASLRRSIARRASTPMRSLEQASPTAPILWPLDPQPRRFG